MPVDLSIKKVPDAVAEKLRDRATRNHRSLQGELLAILEEAADRGALTVQEVYGRARARGVSPVNESAAMLRRMRDQRGPELLRRIERRRDRR